MVMRWELKRTERPTPQSWSPGHMGQSQLKRGLGEQTLFQGTLQLLANGQELDAGPHVRAGRLGDAQGPATAVEVAAVFPDGAEARLEEVDGLAHLDLVDRGVVVVAPKVLDRLDLAAELLEFDMVLVVVGLVVLGLPAGRVSWWLHPIRGILGRERVAGDGGRGPVKVNVPVVLRGQRAHRFEKVALCVIALVGGRGGVDRLRQAGGAAREDLRSHGRHGRRG